MTRTTSLAAAFGVALALGACAGEGGQLATSPEAPSFQVYFASALSAAARSVFSQPGAAVSRLAENP